MLRPVIMIGCGGAGLKTVRLVREGVQRRLDRAGWDGPFPDAWQFIGIDSSKYQEGQSIPALPTSDYINICPFGTYENLVSAVDARFPQGSAGFKEMMGWRPNWNNLGVPLNMALPQARAFGRMMFIASQDIVRQRVKKAFVECAVGGPTLAEVSQRLGVTVLDGTSVPSPLTIVVGSMAGGTGAGFMLDVVDLIRQTQVDGAFPAMIAFTEDIFGFENSLSYDSISNQTAFISEFLSAYWDDDRIDSELVKSPIQVGTRGPHSTFIIGRMTIDGLDLENSLNVYRSVGVMLASVMTSARMQDQFTHDVLNRPFAAPRNSGGHGRHEDLTKGVVSSFGSATLSIGRERFRDYLSRLLHRSIVEHLSEGFNQAAVLYLGWAAIKELPLQGKITELARIHRDEFLFSCQLMEKDNHRQISDSFVSDLHLREEFQTVVDLITSSVAAIQQIDIDLWAVQLECQAHLAREASQKRAEELMLPSLMQWGLDLLQRVLKTCTEFSARLSLPVVKELVELARADVMASSAFMKESANIDRKNAEQMFSLAQSHLLTRADEQLDLTSAPIQNAIQDYAKAISLEWLVTVRDRLVATIESVAPGMLNTIQAELQHSLSRLGKLNTSQGGEVVSFWPKNDNLVPEAFAPSPCEIYLENYSDWPQMARAILEASLGEDRHLLPVDPIDATRTLLIRGGFVGLQGDIVPPLIWVQASEDGDLSWSIEQPVEVSIFDGLIDLEERIDSWLLRSSTATEEYLNEGLSSYLSKVNPRSGTPVTNHASRLAIYQQKLEEALNQSRPLIQIDQKMYTTVHSQEIRTSLIVQGFPFGEDHPARSITQEVVQGFLRTPGDVEWIFSGGEAESVLISSFLDDPVNLSAVSSFTQPLAQSVSNVSPAMLRSSFWRWPRARSLENFIPLPDGLRLAAIRGFAIARALGYCTASATEGNVIVDSEGIHEFPKQLLTATNPNNILPALLEAMILTFADVPIKGKAAFSAYGALISYGMGGRLADDFQLSKVMIDFLDYGVGPEARYDFTPVDPGQAERVSSSDYETRQKNVLEYLDRYLQFLQQLDAKPLSNSHWRDQSGSVDPIDTLTLELMSDLIRGYADVRSAVQNHYQEDVESVS